MPRGSGVARSAFALRADWWGSGTALSHGGPLGDTPLRAAKAAYESSGRERTDPPGGSP